VLKVVLDKPEGTIRAEEVKEDMIVVVASEWQYTPPELFKLHRTKDGKWRWEALGSSRKTACDSHLSDSFQEALKTKPHYATKWEIWAGRSLSELSSWIAANCGERGKGEEAETLPMKEGSFSFCRACGHPEKEFSAEPCKGCRISRPSNFVPR
jgi:hypothetical protein